MGSRKVVKQDPEGDAQKAKDKATEEANREAIIKRRGAPTALGAIGQQEQPQSGTLLGRATKQLLGGNK